MLGGGGGGVGGMLPRHAPPEKNAKNVAIWEPPRYVITNLKIHSFKENKSTITKLNCHISHVAINVDEHVSTEISTYRSDKGVWG